MVRAGRISHGQGIFVSLQSSAREDMMPCHETQRLVAPREQDLRLALAAHQDAGGGGFGLGDHVDSMFLASRGQWAKSASVGLTFSADRGGPLVVAGCILGPLGPSADQRSNRNLSAPHDNIGTAVANKATERSHLFVGLEQSVMVTTVKPVMLGADERRRTDPKARQAGAAESDLA